VFNSQKNLFFHSSGLIPSPFTRKTLFIQNELGALPVC
jgi:hypothetical protein